MSQEFELRVMEEKEQLDNKLLRLREFTTTATYDGLAPESQGLLLLQMQHMEKYSQVLHARIDLFSI